MPKADLSIKKKPNIDKLRLEKRPRSEKYFDTTKYPKFKGTDKEYAALVKKHIKTKQMSTEEFAKQFGTLRKPLDPAKYPNVDITPAMVEEGDLFTSRSSKATQSAYETSNTKNRRAKSMEMQSITTDKEGEFEYHTFQDGEKANADKLGKGRALHHRRGINQYRPFFEGLKQSESIELANWFKQEGYPVGNHLENLVALTENAKDAEKYGLTSEPILHQGSGSIHNWQADVNVEPLNTHPLYKQLEGEMKGKSVAQRIPFIMDYLEKVQDPIESKLGTKGSYEKIRDFKDSVGTIQSGPRAGQRLPVNRRTVGDSIIRDVRKGAKWLPLLGAAAAVTNAGSAFAQGNHAEGAAHLVGGAVGEIPIVGDVAVESVSGTPTADGTMTGRRKDMAIRPNYYGKQGPTVSTPQQSNRAALLRKDPSQERGYETITRVLGQAQRAAGSWMKKLGINF